MVGGAFVVSKEVGLFHHTNGNIFALWERSNDEKLFFLFNFNYIIQQLYSEKNINHSKLKYTDPYNFLIKRALVSTVGSGQFIYLFANDYSSHYIIHMQQMK